jgi:hypothetical protein
VSYFLDTETSGGRLARRQVRGNQRNDQMKEKKKLTISRDTVVRYELNIILRVEQERLCRILYFHIRDYNELDWQSKKVV